MKKDRGISCNPAIGNELVKAKETINEFLYSCSHSMRGPLKSISGLVNLLRQSLKTGNEDPYLYLRLISQSVDKMETLIHQFEQFLENSRKDLTYEPIDIRKIFTDVFNEVPEIRLNGIDVTLHLDQTGYFYSDIHRFHLIIFHLITNAVVFADDQKAVRSVEITVRATQASCSIQISDNGIGIPYEIQNKIYDLFYRGSEKSLGSGVGLYIVQEVLKKMGGSISVNSTPWQGSSFFIWLPNAAE